MSWPIGYGTPGVKYRADFGGGVVANDVRVSDPDGWIELLAPHDDAVVAAITLRVRVSVDAHGHPFLYADGVRAGSRSYRSVHAFVTSEGSDWLPHLTRALHAEIARRVIGAVRTARAGVPAQEIPRRPSTRPDPRVEPEAEATRAEPKQSGIAAAVRRTEDNESDADRTGQQRRVTGGH